jgi:hypothetical protein
MRIFNGKSLGLISIAAAVLLGANGAFAAESAVDAQTQARALLSGTVAGVKAVNLSPAAEGNGRQAFNADPQEQARQLILGNPGRADITHRAIAEDVKMTSVREQPRTESQESARRLLLSAGF